MSVGTEEIQIALALVGWIVAFLLGKELATGFSLWRARRAERPISREDSDRP